MPLLVCSLRSVKESQWNVNNDTMYVERTDREDCFRPYGYLAGAPSIVVWARESQLKNGIVGRLPKCLILKYNCTSTSLFTVSMIKCAINGLSVRIPKGIATTHEMVSTKLSYMQVLLVFHMPFISKPCSKICTSSSVQYIIKIRTLTSASTLYRCISPQNTTGVL